MSAIWTLIKLMVAFAYTIAYGKSQYKLKKAAEEHDVCSTILYATNSIIYGAVLIAFIFKYS